MSLDIFNLSPGLFLKSLNAIICSRFFMVVVIFRECGPGTSVTGYVWPIAKSALISRIKYLVSPLMVLLQFVVNNEKLINRNQLTLLQENQ